MTQRSGIVGRELDRESCRALHRPLHSTDRAPFPNPEGRGKPSSIAGRPWGVLSPGGGNPPFARAGFTFARAAIVSRGAVASVGLGIALAALAFLAAPGGAMADEATLAKSKAMQLCANCHGQQGLASMPRTPHLAGQDQEYLVEQLKHYRSGRRHHEVMSVIAKTLSDQDIVLTSSWFASLRISVEDKP